MYVGYAYLGTFNVGHCECIHV